MVFKMAYAKIKEDVENYIGQEVDVKSYGERNSVKNYRGVIESFV